MTAHQLDDALAELELLADQLERVEPDLTRSLVTEARAVRIDAALLPARMGDL